MVLPSLSLVTHRDTVIVISGLGMEDSMLSLRVLISQKYLILQVIEDLPFGDEGRTGSDCEVSLLEVICGDGGVLRGCLGLFGIGVEIDSAGEYSHGLFIGKIKTFIKL